MIPGLSIPITIDLQRLYGQKINLVQGENAGRRLAFTIVSGGVAVNLTGKILLLTGTKSDGSPVCLPITISSATAGQAYCDIVSGLVSAVGDATLQIRILTPSITGTATSGTTTSMYDTSKTWTVNAYVGSWLYINSGTGINQARRIISNTATQLVVSDAWGTNPAAGSGYSIVTETGFSFPFTANVAASPDADAGIVQTGDFSALTAAIATALGLDAAAVHKAGAETITGLKSVPTPTAAAHIATKDYVDQNINFVTPTYGIWYPTFAGSTTPGENQYSVRVGRWCKNGKLVHIEFSLTMSARDSAMAGVLKITDLPFAAAGNPTADIGICSGITMSTTYNNQISGVVSGSSIALYGLSNGSFDNVPCTGIVAGALIQGSADYMTA